MDMGTSAETLFTAALSATFESKKRIAQASQHLMVPNTKIQKRVQVLKKSLIEDARRIICTRSRVGAIEA